MSKETKNDDDKSSSSPLSGEPAGINTGVAIIGFILCFLAGAVLMWGYDQQRIQQRRHRAPTRRRRAPSWADSDSPDPGHEQGPDVGQSRNAPVTIVHFSDFQCPFCSRVEPTLDQIKTTYGPDKVRIVWKNKPLPFHQNAKPAAEAAAGRLRARGQRRRSGSSTTRRSRTRRTLGPTATRSGRRRRASTWRSSRPASTRTSGPKKVDEDHADGKQGSASTARRRSSSTASIVSGAQPFDKFKDVIDEELAKAAGEDRGRHAEGQGLRRDVRRRTRRTPRRPKAEDEGEKEDTKTVWKVPVGKSPDPRQRRTRSSRSSSSRTSSARSASASSRRSSRSATSTATRSASSGRTSRFRSTRAPSPPPRSRMEARAEKGDKGFWDAHDKLFDIAAEARGRGSREASRRSSASTSTRSRRRSRRTSTRRRSTPTPTSARTSRRAARRTSSSTAAASSARSRSRSSRRSSTRRSRRRRTSSRRARRASDVYDELMKDGKGRRGRREEGRRRRPPQRPCEGQHRTRRSSSRSSRDFQCPFCKRVEDDGQRGHEELRRQDEVRLARHAAPDAPGRAARGARPRGGVQAEGHRRLLEDARQAVREPAERRTAQARRPREATPRTSGSTWTSSRPRSTASAHKAEIDADDKAGNDAGISGTPAFVINGYFISGAQPYPKFKKLIDSALAEAK